MKSSSLITGSLRLSSSRWQRNTAYKNSNVLQGDLISGSLQWRYRCHNSPTSSWRRRLFCNKKKLINSWLPPTWPPDQRTWPPLPWPPPSAQLTCWCGWEEGVEARRQPRQGETRKALQHKCYKSYFTFNHHDHHHHPGYTAVGPPVGRPQDQGRGRCLALLPKSVEAMSPLLSVWNTCDTFWISLSTKSIIPAIKKQYI